MSIPLVTIRCITYNHEDYIRECLEGFIMQQTDFPFEAVVHDDASTDGTAEIIREYAEKYPDIIKPIFETENQYSKHDGSLWRIMNKHMRGKYIAFCEGDDYWTDPHKLQKQVDFLESRPDCAMCFHNAYVQTELDEKWRDRNNLFSNIQNREYYAEEIIKWIVPTCSAVIRSDALQHHPNIEGLHAGDTPLFLSMAVLGSVYGFSDVMSVYRRHKGSWSDNENYLINRNIRQDHSLLKEIYPESMKSIFDNSIVNLAVAESIFLLRDFKMQFIPVFFSLSKQYGMKYVLSFSSYLFKLFKHKFKI